MRLLNYRVCYCPFMNLFEAILVLPLIFVGIVIFAAFLPVVIGGSIIWGVLKLAEHDQKMDDGSIEIRGEIRFVDH